jgi:hypothetical protein
VKSKEIDKQSRRKLDRKRGNGPAVDSVCLAMSYGGIDVAVRRSRIVLLAFLLWNSFLSRCRLCVAQRGGAIVLNVFIKPPFVRETLYVRDAGLSFQS